MEENKNIMEVLNLNADSIEITKNAKGTWQFSVKKYGPDYNKMLTDIKAIITEIEKSFTSG